MNRFSRLLKGIFFSLFFIIVTISHAQNTDKEKQKLYQENLKKGMELFSIKDYENAKKAFEKALIYKPDANYAKMKLKEISNYYISPEDEKKYNSLLTEAVKLLEKQKYPDALEKYQKALNIKPKEISILNKIKEIQNFIKASAGRETDYQDAIKKAQAYYQQKKYQDAMALYQDALLIKPGQELPKTRIEELKTIISKQQKIDSDYKAEKRVIPKSFKDKAFGKLSYQYDQQNKSC